MYRLGHNCQLEAKNIFRAKLSTWIYNENRLGNVPRIDEEAIARAKSSRRVPVGARSDKLLSFLASRGQVLGQTGQTIDLVYATGSDFSAPKDNIGNCSPLRAR
jgi:hypothetical protein